MIEDGCDEGWVIGTVAWLDGLGTLGRAGVWSKGLEGAGVESTLGRARVGSKGLVRRSVSP